MLSLTVNFLEVEPSPTDEDGGQTASDSVEATAPLVVLLDGKELEPESIERGRVRYLLTDDVSREQLGLAWAGGERQPFPETLFETMQSPDEDAAIIVPSLPPSAAPFLSGFVPRVSIDGATQVKPPPVGGFPDLDLDVDVWKVPVTGLAVKQTVTYLAPSQELRPSVDWTPGYVHELESNWEPLGWALDEWVSTVSLGPYEDTMTASSRVSGASMLQEDSAEDATDQTDAAERGTTASADEMATSSRDTGRQTGFGAGLGRTTSGSSVLSLVNPVATLAEAVTGAVQLGFSTSKIDTTVGSRGDLRRAVTNAVETKTRLDRERSAAALARAVGSFANTRQLRALRNLAGPRTLNLACFSVVRHWLVTTLQARVRPVVFIRADRLDEPFTHQDLFLNKGVLRQVLLDESLAPALLAAARDFTPTPPAQDPAEETVRSIRITATVADAAEGHGSTIEAGAVFSAGRAHFPVFGEIEASEAGQEVTWQLQGGSAPLRQLTSWKFVFHHPNRWNRDREARLDNVRADVVVDTRQGQKTYRLDLSNQIRLRENLPTIVEARLPADTPHSTPAYDDQLARVLAHLEANRAYYRVAIDLAMDPIQRFETLARRASTLPMPLDMRPVGVTGTHLAFHASAASGAQPAPLLGEPMRQLAATPAGGTFCEAIGGSKVSTDFKDLAVLPTAAAQKDTSFTWPDLEAPAPLDRSGNGQLADKDVPAPTPPGLAASPLVAALGSTSDAVAKLQDTLKAVQDEVVKAFPATPAAPPGATPTDGQPAGHTTGSGPGG